jgi:hypothetical protein
MLCRCFADLLVVALLECEGVTAVLQSSVLRCVDTSALLLIFGTLFFCGTAGIALPPAGSPVPFIASLAARERVKKAYKLGTTIAMMRVALRLADPLS